MGTLTLQRHSLPFWPTAALAVIAWLIAWVAAWPASQWVAFDLLGGEHGSSLGEAVAFFAYDVPKVLLLLLGIVTIVSFLRSYIPGTGSPTERHGWSVSFSPRSLVTSGETRTPCSRRSSAAWGPPTRKSWPSQDSVKLSAGTWARRSGREGAVQRTI
jgi:hypothetical protein